MMTDQRRVLLIGLGNPGADYENTYHNVGALALDRVMETMPGRGAAHWEIHKKLFFYAKSGDLNSCGRSRS